MMTVYPYIATAVMKPSTLRRIQRFYHAARLILLAVGLTALYVALLAL